MRIVWAVRCLWAEPATTTGLWDAYGAGFDTMIVPRLGGDGGIRVLVRLKGTAHDFREHHELRVTLTNPEMQPIGTLDHPVEPRQPSGTGLPGYEINYDS